jgi:peptidoglycan/xylan/chitin deacetylase (PgdA/CDA1 family)
MSLRAMTVTALDAVGLRKPLRWLVRDVLGVGRRLAPPVAPRPLISVAPHNVKLFEYLIRYHLAERRRFITSDELYGPKPLDSGTEFLLLRHDVDYTPENLMLLVELEQRYGIRSDIHVVMDASHYDAREHADLWRRLAAEGFHFGLHTLAPQHPDFYTVLRDEIGRFEDLLGFPPRTFSIHGVTPRIPDWQQRRERFLGKIGPRLASFGFTGSHNISGIATWIEDSGAGGEFAYLYLDWVQRLPTPGTVLGVLAHPDHWAAWPIRWKVNYDEVSESPLLERFVRIARQYQAAN